MYFNKCSIQGNLGGDAEIRSTNGGKVASFSIANTRPFGKKETTWFRVSWFGGTRLDAIADSLVKGTRVIVTGEIYQSAPFTTSSGETRQSLEFSAQDVQLIDGRREVDASGEGAPDEDALF